MSTIRIGHLAKLAQRFVRFSIVIISCCAVITGPPTACAQRVSVEGLPLRVLSTDRLTDFVVDHGDWWGHPTSREALDEAIREQKAQRSSAFFVRREPGNEPFYGDLPLKCCYREYETDVGRTQLETWKGLKKVRLQLPRLKAPHVFVVGAGSIFNAQVATCEAGGKPAVAYPYEQYWAAVYCGSGGSNPQKYVLDRATIGRTSATISIFCPRRGFSTMDSRPYWFFVPLGRLAEGEYSVEVRLANDESELVSTTSVLRYATPTEVEERGEYSNQVSEFVNQQFRVWNLEDETAAAELQLRLERLSDFVANQELSDTDRELLAKDVATLGAAADWSKDHGLTPRRWPQRLEPATPGKEVNIGYVNPVLDYPHTPWEKSGVRLKDVWLTAGEETEWFTSKMNRQEVGLDAKRERRIQEILAEVKKQAYERTARGTPLWPMIAAGTFEEAIDAAYEVYVEGHERAKELPAQRELWAVMVAPGSYLVRQINTREYRETSSTNPIRQYRIHTSAYLESVDDVKNASSSTTLAFIPLGKHDADRSVAVLYDCTAVSCRQLGPAAKTTPLVDVRMPGTMMNRYNDALCTGCRVSVVEGGR